MNKFLKYLFLLFLFPFSGNSQPIETIPADSIIAFGKKQMGIKYNYGSINPDNGFDCSGFVYYVYRHFNINVPRASMDYEKMGREIPTDSCKPGDIIVFTGTNGKIRKAGHVGIILSNPGETITFMHSSSGKKRNGVIVTNFNDSPYYKVRFIKIVRLSSVI